MIIVPESKNEYWRVKRIYIKQPVFLTKEGIMKFKNKNQKRFTAKPDYLLMKNRITFGSALP